MTSELLDRLFREQLEAFIAIGGDVKATLRRFCWQAKQDGLKDHGCAEEAPLLSSFKTF